MTESALAFACDGDALVGVLHQPDAPHQRGALFVVGGGAQYRAGGRRQMTLWSRRLCAQGFPVFRFDYRGMGDSHGKFMGVEGIDDDIRTAVDRFMEVSPGVKEVVLWGECDASSAILFYAYRDARIKGVVLLNPWVRTQPSEAQAILRFYYLQRILQPSFWKKVLSLSFNPVASLRAAVKLMKLSGKPAPTSQPVDSHSLGASMPREGPLPERLLLGLSRFAGPVMLVLSGRDLIAQEFDVLVNNSPAWQEQFGRKPVTRYDLPDSDHTFSSAAQRDQVVGWALQWLRGW